MNKQSTLLKLQSFSFLSRFGTMLVGNVFQSLIVLRLLSQQEYGMVAVVASLVSVFGSSQSFGLTSSSTREISQAKDKEEAREIFITSLILRFILSFPFALALFLLSSKLAQSSSSPEMVSSAIKITAIIMFFEPLRGVFNSVISAFHKFKILFLYQFLIALVSLCIYAPLLYLYGFRGYYWAALVFAFIATFVLGYFASGVFRNLPFKKIPFKRILFHAKDLVGISLSLYLLKVLYSYWLSGPALFLNYFPSNFITNSFSFYAQKEELIAIFALALLFATKLLVFSDSITDVTLPINSKKFVENKDAFKSQYKLNYQKTTVVIAFFCSIFAFFNSEIIYLLNIIVHKDYSMSSVIIPLVVIAVWFYSNVDLLKSSVFVPAKKLLGMVFIHIFLLFSTYFLFFLFISFFTNVLIAFALSFALSAIISYILVLLVLYTSLNYIISSFTHIIYFLISLVFILSYYLQFGLEIKLLVFALYFLTSLFIFSKIGILKQIVSKFTKMA